MDTFRIVALVSVSAANIFLPKHMFAVDLEQDKTGCHQHMRCVPILSGGFLKLPFLKLEKCLCAILLKLVSASTQKKKFLEVQKLAPFYL